MFYVFNTVNITIGVKVSLKEPETYEKNPSFAHHFAFPQKSQNIIVLTHDLMF